MAYFFHMTLLALTVFVYRFYSKYYDLTPCGSDPPVEMEGIWFLDENNKNDDNKQKNTYTFRDTCKLFSSNYFEARSKFRAAVKAYNTTSLTTAGGAHAERWSSHLAVVQGGIYKGQTLTLDVAVLPGNTQKLGTIVHSSGVHGVEGYAGSAVQLALLELLTQNSELVPPEDRPTVVMVHAVNPVGMSEYRRCNENNVDLNRNGIILTSADDNDDENKATTMTTSRKKNGVHSSFKEFLSQRDPNIAGYEDFRHLFVPEVHSENEHEENLSWYENTIGFFVRTIPAVAQHGLAALKRGMVAGQYHHPEGLNYGGQDWQPSVERLLNTFATDRPEFFKDSPNVLWIDVHTGLGPFGKDTVNRQAHIQHPATEEQEEDTDVELDAYLKTAYSVMSSVAGGKDTAEAFKGYDLSKGMLTEFLGDSYRKAVLQSESRKEGIFLIQEFGTLPTILVGRALILDNVLYHFRKHQHQRRRNNNNNEGGFSYRSPYLRYAFYPQSTEWRSSLIRRGVAIVLQGMEYSTARSKSRLS